MNSTGTHARRQAQLRYRLRAGALLCCAVIALHGLGARVTGQQDVPKTVRVEVANPLRKPLQYRFSGKEPQAETELEFVGDGQNWSFINFERIPPGTVLKVKGKPDGYQDSEFLQSQRWYPFKNRLPVILVITPNVRSPIELVFWFGVPNTGGGAENYLKTQPPEGVRTYAENNPIKEATDRQLLAFSWEAPAASGSPPSSPTSSSTNASSPLPTATPTPRTSWLTYMKDEHPYVGLIILIAAAAVVFALFVFLPQFNEYRQRLLERRGGGDTRPGKTEREPSRQVGPLADLSNPGETSVDHGAEPAIKATGMATEHPATASSADDTVKRERLRAPVGQDRRPQTRGGAATFRGPARGALSSDQDGRQFDELPALVQKLQSQVNQIVSRPDALTPGAKGEVESLLLRSQNDQNERVGRVKQELTQRLDEGIDAAQNLISDHETMVRGELEKATTQITEAYEEGRNVKEHLLNVLEELKKVEARLEGRIRESQEAFERRAKSDSIYAKMLGDVLGQVEALQNGNFEQLMGERLNGLFQSGVGRGEGLQELRVQAEAINDALKGVAAQMEKLNPPAAGEARQYQQRVQGLVDELSGLQTQLQNRRTTLRIPVSLHAGARQTFLDELGRGLRREIDKLAEPESYFKGELERAITADVIAVVDICDKKVAPPPGSRPELESALKSLFEQAGLRPILPRRGDPFKTAEQDLIDMVQGGGGQSLTVQQVSTRGFYYKHDGTETLLRKASVTVHR